MATRDTRGERTRRNAPAKKAGPASIATVGRQSPNLSTSWLTKDAVCRNDEACVSLVGPPGAVDQGPDDAVCYKDGFTVKRMYQMCDVTSEHARLFRFGGTRLTIRLQTERSWTCCRAGPRRSRSAAMRPRPPASSSSGSAASSRSTAASSSAPRAWTRAAPVAST